MKLRPGQRKPGCVHVHVKERCVCGHLKEMHSLRLGCVAFLHPDALQLCDCKKFRGLRGVRASSEKGAANAGTMAASTSSPAFFGDYLQKVRP